MNAYMAAGAERSKALHNFTMPADLRWGNQRFLRCMKVNSDGQISPLRRFAADDSYTSDQRRYRGDFAQPPRNSRHRERGREKDSTAESLHGSDRLRPPPPSPADGGRRFSDDDGGIAATREKVMLDLQTAADKMKDAIFKDGLKETEISGSPPPPSVAASVDGEIQRPWNLRSRRAACKIPSTRFVSSAAAVTGSNDSAGRKGFAPDVPKYNSGFPQSRTVLPAAMGDNSPVLRSGVTASGEKTERAKFSVALSKSEIEEDFMKLLGHRPPRRPKKRAKIVQRQLDTLFPGLWLKEVTPEMYKVNDATP